MLDEDEDFNDDVMFDDYDYDPDANDGKTMNKLEKTKESAKQSFLWKKGMEVRKLAGVFSARYPNAIKHAITTCESIIDFYRRRNVIALVRGGFQIFETIQGSNLHNFYQFANSSDGFRYLTHNKNNIGFLFRDTLIKFPKEIITFKNNESCDVYHLELGDVYYHTAGSEFYIYYNEKKIKKEELIKFLVDEKFKDLDSNFLYLQSKENESGLSLTAHHPALLPSVKADELKKVISQFNEIGINRSLLLYGVPGVGKTSLAFKILFDLKYRTICFSASNKLISFDLIKSLIELLSVDAIIIDDFDQFNQTNKTLDILEMFNRKCKVLIGIANTLKEMHTAIIRPGRFDNLVLVDQLDDACVSSVLGKYKKDYMKRVQKWPIAFITELTKSAQFLSKTELESYYEELSERVRYQIGDKAMGPRKPTIKKSEPSKKKTVSKKIKGKSKVKKAIKNIVSIASSPEPDDWDDAIDDELEESWGT